MGRRVPGDGRATSPGEGMRLTASPTLWPMVTVVWRDADARRRALTEELARLTAVLRDLPGVVEAWVFGSAATGRVHSGSDIDLLVVRDTAESPVERGLTLHRELAPRLATDLFVYNPEEFAAEGRFVRSVRRQGHRLW